MDMESKLSLSKTRKNSVVYFVDTEVVVDNMANNAKTQEQGIGAR